jgi:hypothetical protein
MKSYIIINPRLYSLILILKIETTGKIDLVNYDLIHQPDDMRQIWLYSVNIDWVH